MVLIIKIEFAAHTLQSWTSPPQKASKNPSGYSHGTGGDFGTAFATRTPFLVDRRPKRRYDTGGSGERFVGRRALLQGDATEKLGLLSWPAP